MSRTLITPYFDPDYNNADFKEGALKAIEAVSDAFAEEQDDALNDLDDVITLDCMRKLRYAHRRMRRDQRRLVRTKADDFFWSFIHQIGIIMRDLDDVERRRRNLPDEAKHSRIVEITFVAYSAPNYFDLSEEPQEIFQELKSRIQDARKIQSGTGFLFENGQVANYRFVKDFTKGVKDIWRINMANHFTIKEMTNI